MVYYSKQLENFLKFIRESKSEYNIAVTTEKECNEEICDIEHSLELAEHPYHDYAKLAKGIKASKEKRREAKDTQFQLQPIIDWASNNDQVIKKLEKLLGDVRTREKRLTTRTYTSKTEVVKEILGEVKKN